MALVVPGVRPVKRRAVRRWGTFTPLILLAPAMLWLTVFFVVPTFSLASQSLQTGDIDNGFVLTWHFQTYAEALGRYWPQFLRSLIYAGSATVITLLVGYPLAWFIAHRSGRFKTMLLVLVIAPFFTNFLIRTLAWQIILTDTGPVTGFFRATGLIHVLQWLGLVTSDALLYSPFAVISGLAYNFLPFMVLPLYTSLERLDLRYLDAAGDLYANGWNTFWKVIWPLSLPGVVSGTLLTFIPAAGDYINSKLLGNTQTVMIGQVIDAQFLRVLDYPTAAALSFILMATIIVMVGLYVRAAGTEELV
ncbi:ABC transporter permease [Propionicimonas sp.]|uniref:ABC transporter permease n=1 Tax=Propionicimonas sp. TaxID=1955623 RepID=UPI0017B53C60|nr:ABC transporter permease [Propionicimonas sp.]MBU3976432.1 ABC transporter permease [Actinomycetota bacterium]MBA3020272.1 ABC transporter permease [Propionicimonas sp.]MBU3986059.1 ABC transporter permease [Actinomycetota bacterium]MBU4007576.1 ABC transporter permease [Actinomycetota bacterium]MBU4064357.1 ABC transporter permease [Actinomycetota bacterium]